MAYAKPQLGQPACGQDLKSEPLKYGAVQTTSATFYRMRKIWRVKGEASRNYEEQ
jgi:hypothetical protein